MILPKNIQHLPFLEKPEFKELLNRLISNIRFYDEKQVNPREFAISYGEYGFKDFEGDQDSISSKSKQPNEKFRMHTHASLLVPEEEYKQDLGTRLGEYFSNADLRLFEMNGIPNCIMFRRPQKEKMAYYLKCIDPKKLSINDVYEYDDFFKKMEKIIYSNQQRRKEIESATKKEDVDALIDKMIHAKAPTKEENQEKSDLLQPILQQMNDFEKKHEIQTVKVKTIQKPKNNRDEVSVTTFMYSPAKLEEYAIPRLSRYEYDDYKAANPKKKLPEDQKKYYTKKKSWLSVCTFRLEDWRLADFNKNIHNDEEWANNYVLLDAFNSHKSPYNCNPISFYASGGHTYDPKEYYPKAEHLGRDRIALCYKREKAGQRTDTPTKIKCFLPSDMEKLKITMPKFEWKQDLKLYTQQEIEGFIHNFKDQNRIY